MLKTKDINYSLISIYFIYSLVHIYFSRKKCIDVSLGREFAQRIIKFSTKLMHEFTDVRK